MIMIRKWYQKIVSENVIRIMIKLWSRFWSCFFAMCEATYSISSTLYKTQGPKYFLSIELLNQLNVMSAFEERTPAMHTFIYNWIRVPACNAVSEKVWYACVDIHLESKLRQEIQFDVVSPFPLHVFETYFHTKTILWHKKYWLRPCARDFTK